MAAARKSCDFDFNVSNNSRSRPTQAQSPRMALPSKSPREVGKQENISLGYDPVGNVSLGYKAKRVYDADALHKQLDPGSYYKFPTYDYSWSELEKLLARRTILHRKFDQMKRTYVEKWVSSLPLPQNSSTLYEEIARLGRYPAASPREMDLDTRIKRVYRPRSREFSLRRRPSVDDESVTRRRFLQARSVMVKAKSFGSNIRQRSLYQPINDQDSGKERREKWTQIVRFYSNEAASKGVLAGSVDNQIDTLFLLKITSSQGPCGSTSSAETTGSNLLNHSIGEVTVAPNELDLFGRDWIHRWKDGAGRNKDWRSTRYLKCLRKGERAKCQLLPSGRRSSPRNWYRSKAASHHLAITHSAPHIAVPKDMLRQKSTSCQGHSSCLKPKSTWQAMNDVGLNTKTKFAVKSSTRCEPWMNDPMDSLDAEESWMSEDRFNTNPEISK